MQPVLAPTYKLDARTVELLKSNGVIHSAFDMNKWFIEEQTKNNHLYLSELALYNSGIAGKYDKLVMLATNVCDSNPKEFNKEHLRLMLISIKKYFDVTTYTSDLIDVPLCDDYHYNNGYWSDEETDSESKEDRDIESYRSTADYFSIAETFSQNGEVVSWEDNSIFENAFAVGRLWTMIGYDVYIAIFCWDREFIMRMKQFGKDPTDAYSFGVHQGCILDNDNGLWRIYVNRK